MGSRTFVIYHGLTTIVLTILIECQSFHPVLALDQGNLFRGPDSPEHFYIMLLKSSLPFLIMLYAKGKGSCPKKS